MHEFSLAQNIVEIAEESAKKAGKNTVAKVDVEAGTQSGVVFEALETAMEAIKKGTMLENAKIIIHRIQARARCNECSHEFDIQELYDACPKCGSFMHEILCGTELRVKSLEAE
jgi:hydrogenase nickel incorporation protein HypA/HybF